jgi:predicted aspartyl protease
MVDMNNHIIEGLIDTGASMSIIVASVVKELGIMHLVIGLKSYKIAPKVVTHAMGRINELSVNDVGKLVCKMDFMVVDTRWV